ncbi:MAG: hypothetical protein ACLQED_15230 [Desulfobaccales bacterium]
MKARILGLFGIICLGVAAAFLAVAAMSAQAPPPDVGLITQLSGPVTYWNKEEQKEPLPAQAFMKVRQGDHLKLPRAASLTLLYFASGRQETWRGPVSLIAGDRESTTADDQKPSPQPEVQILPTKVTKLIAGAPLPSVSSPARSGVIQTMAPTCPPPAKPSVTLSKEAQQQIQEAEKTYQDLRKRAGAEDVTPELYFLGVLADYQQYPKMEKFVDAMLAKRPGDPSLERLKAWVRSQAAATK